MTMTQNKKDFEAALEKVEDRVSDLECVLDADIINDIKSVIDEYKDHLINDIDGLIGENEALTDINDGLSIKVMELLNEG